MQLHHHQMQLLSEPEVHAQTPVLRSQNNVHVGRKRPRALLEGGSMLTSRGSLNERVKEEI